MELSDYKSEVKSVATPSPVNRTCFSGASSGWTNGYPLVRRVVFVVRGAYKLPDGNPGGPEDGEDQHDVYGDQKASKSLDIRLCRHVCPD